MCLACETCAVLLTAPLNPQSESYEVRCVFCLSYLNKCAAQQANMGAWVRWEAIPKLNLVLDFISLVLKAAITIFYMTLGQSPSVVEFLRVFRIIFLFSAHFVSRIAFPLPVSHCSYISTPPHSFCCFFFSTPSPTVISHSLCGSKDSFSFSLIFQVIHHSLDL